MPIALTRSEAQMRTLTGQIEELTHQLQVLQDQLKRIQDDTEFRFSELNGGKGAPPVLLVPDLLPLRRQQSLRPHRVLPSQLPRRRRSRP